MSVVELRGRLYWSMLQCVIIPMVNLGISVLGVIVSIRNNAILILL